MLIDTPPSSDFDSPAEKPKAKKRAPTQRAAASKKSAPLKKDAIAAESALPVKRSKTAAKKVKPPPLAKAEAAADLPPEPTPTPAIEIVVKPSPAKSSNNKRKTTTSAKKVARKKAQTTLPAIKPDEAIALIIDTTTTAPPPSLAVVEATEKALTPSPNEALPVVAHTKPEPESESPVSANPTDAGQLMQQRIFCLSGRNVMLDADVAQLYGVEPTVLFQVVAEQIERFPADFLFQLTEQEFAQVSRPLKNGTQSEVSTHDLPYAFTEQGIAMASCLLPTAQAKSVHLELIRTWIDLCGANQPLPLSSIRSETRETWVEQPSSEPRGRRRRRR